MLEFKIVQKDNIGELAALAFEIWHEYWPLLLTEEQINYMVENFQSQKAIERQIENENYTYFFIINDNQIAGYAGISDKCTYLFLSKLYIKKEWRHKGLGRKVIDYLKRMKFPRIRLTVNKYNKNTINAYLKYGFKITDSVITDIGQGFVMDDYIMELDCI